MYKKMSYGSEGNRESRTSRARTSKKVVPKKTVMDKKPEEKKAGRNMSQAKSSKRGGQGMVKRLTEAQMKRLKEHAKMHKGGMSGKHMKKMIMVMTKEGKSFSEAHKIAVKHDKAKK